MFGVLFNMVWQVALWIQDIQAVDFSTMSTQALMKLTFDNLIDNVIYEGFKPTILFVPFYSMLAMALPYAFYVYDVKQ